jgi:hypothetical protein
LKFGEIRESLHNFSQLCHVNYESACELISHDPIAGHCFVFLINSDIENSVYYLYPSIEGVNFTSADTPCDPEPRAHATAGSHLGQLATHTLYVKTADISLTDACMLIDQICCCVIASFSQNYLYMNLFQNLRFDYTVNLTLMQLYCVQEDKSNFAFLCECCKDVWHS